MCRGDWDHDSGVYWYSCGGLYIDNNGDRAQGTSKAANTFLTVDDVTNPNLLHVISVMVIG